MPVGKVRSSQFWLMQGKNFMVIKRRLAMRIIKDGIFNSILEDSR